MALMWLLLSSQNGPIISMTLLFLSMMRNPGLRSFDKVIFRVCFVVGKISSVWCRMWRRSKADSGEVEEN